MQDPTKYQMLKFLRGQLCGESLRDNLFDVEEAIYWFASDFHGGQWTALYSALSTSPYRPGRCASGPEDNFLYNCLVEEFAPECAIDND